MKEYRIVTGRDYDHLREKCIFWQSKGFTVVEPKPVPSQLIAKALKYEIGCVPVLAEYEPMRIMERERHGEIYCTGSEDAILIESSSNGTD